MTQNTPDKSTKNMEKILRFFEFCFFILRFSMFRFHTSMRRPTPNHHRRISTNATNRKDKPQGHTDFRAKSTSITRKPVLPSPQRARPHQHRRVMKVGPSRRPTMCSLLPCTTRTYHRFQLLTDDDLHPLGRAEIDSLPV